MSAIGATINVHSVRYFYIGMAATMLATVVIGFAPTFYLKSAFGGPPLTPLVQLHGVLFSAWMLLFMAQTSLVAAGRVAVHRRLGIVGAVLALSLLVIGVMTAIAAATRGHAPMGAPALPFLAIPLASILVFGATVAAALHFRRRSEIHKRLMLVATIGILTPAIARMHLEIGGLGGPPLGLLLTDLFLVPCLLYDKLTVGRIHPAYLWAGGLLLASQIGRLLIMRTDAWLAIATWLTS